MFEDCNTMDELNRQRVEAIKSGHPAVLINKAYAKRKSMLLSGGDRAFKKLVFVSKPIPDPEVVIGIDNVSWDDANPYTLYVEV